MGYAFPGSKRLYVDRWLLAVDTSGSCFEKETLSRWKGIMDQLAESFPIDYVEFDTKAMSNPQSYTRKVSFNFKGGGGTSFEPVSKLCDDRHYVGVIFLTDGCAEAPHKPNRTKVLWCLPNKGFKPPVEWGDRVYIEA
jgi:predicted metal-dependent peptidase